MRVPQRKRADSTTFNEEILTEDGVHVEDSLACADFEVPTDETISTLPLNKTLLASFPRVTSRQHRGLDQAVLKWECSKLPDLPLKRSETEEFSESTDEGSENSWIVDVDTWTGADQGDSALSGAEGA
jgi:hypothetical protein